MRFTVYDPKGEMFEVPAWTAKDLIINHGWSPTPPQSQTEQPVLPLVEDEQPSARAKK